MKTNRFLRPAIGTSLLLCVPLAMTVLDRQKPDGEGWHWGLADFVVMGALLLGAGLLYELLASQLSKPVHRATLASAIVLLVLVIWAELAVGAVSQTLRLVIG